MQDSSWFRPLNNELNAGGYAALLYDLQRHDLGKFHPRQIPRDKNEIVDQQASSLAPLDAWFVELLETGVLPRHAVLNPAACVSGDSDATMRRGL